MLAFIKLYTINFWKSKSGPFYVFAFPLMMLFILGNIMPFSYIAGGLIVLPAITVGTMITPMGLADFKSSRILKRIALTTVTKTKLITSLFIFNILLTFVSTATTIIAVLLVNKMEIGNVEINGTSFLIDLSKIDLGEWAAFAGILLVISMSMSAIGIFIGLKAKDAMSGMTKGMFAYFPITFLGGVFLDVNTLKDSGLMNNISMALPFRWLIEPVVNMFATGQMFNADMDQWTKWAGPVGGIALAAIFLALSLKSYKEE